MRFLFRCEDLFVGNNSSNNLKSYLRFAIVFCFQRKALLTWLYCFQKLDAVPIAFSTCNVPSHFHSLWLTSTDQPFPPRVRPTRCSSFSWKTKRNMKTEWKQSEGWGILVCVDSRAFRAFVFSKEKHWAENQRKLEPWQSGAINNWMIFVGTPINNWANSFTWKNKLTPFCSDVGFT